jgi:hypothetical protein
VNVIVVVDSHHKAIAAWANCRASKNVAPRLITLDHHTDTSKPFRNYLNTHYGRDYEFAENLRANWLQDLDFRNSQTVDLAISKLSNDEHIITAIKTDIISSAFVVAHNAINTDFSVYKEHKVVCRGVDKGLKDNNTRASYDEVLESPFLDWALSSFNEILIQARELQLHQSPYILDIDLDYLNTFKSVQPKDSNTLRQLAAGADLITLATEPEYVKSCAIDQGLNSEYLLDQLRALLD